MYLVKFISNLFFVIVFFVTSVYAADHTVTSTSDTGPGSLRQAITDANGTAESDTIAFDSVVFPSTTPATITLASPLPALDDNAGTTIDGNGGVIITGIDNDFVGMTIRSSNNIVRGLQLQGLRLGIEFDRNTINSNNIIGGTAPGQRNVISNNWVAGINLSGVNTSNNAVVGNFIGLNSSGTAAVGIQDVGVDIARGAHGNIIGGSTPGEKNIISGNTFVGIRLSDTEEQGTSNNRILGNYIGTDYSGALAIPNNRGGVGIGQNAAGNFIGGTVPGSGNVISGHTGATPHGIRFSQTSGNYIYGNIIGLTADALAPLPNGYGIRLEFEANNNTIGGPSENMRNLISGNSNTGISLDDSGGNIIQGNLIGSDASGTAALGNTIYGIYIGGDSTNNLVGGTDSDSGNIISGGHIRGISISGTTASNNRVLGNYVGTDISGTLPLGNDDGIRITDAQNNIIGGAETGASNVISGNNVFGIVVSNSSAIGNQILGNKIGTDLSGTVALGNGTTGIYVGSSASGNIIGGTTTGAGNLVSSNGFRGIQVSNGASNNQILGNFIGTDVTGTVALGNLGDGIMIHNSPDNFVGGTAPGAGNVISGNGDDGLSILEPNAFGNQIIGNYIGTDVNGVNVIGNLRGVQIANAPNNTLGHNLIHHNASHGVLIQSSEAVNNTLTQNSITANGGGIRIGIGANLDIPAPAITGITVNQVFGTSTAPDSSDIEIFQDTGDQGNIYIGTASVSGGAFIFTGTPPPGATSGNLTATVTDPAGNTSEFSPPVPNELSIATVSLWHIETVDDSLDDFSRSVSLALDALGNPHISYRAHLTGGYHDLKYAIHDGSNWQIEIADPEIYSGSYASMAIDPFGYPHISYNDFYSLQHAEFNGINWNVETVDFQGHTGSDPSIAIDSLGGLHIGYDDYTDNTNINLKYAYYNGLSWNIETVDSYGCVGIHTSVAVDSYNLPRISYLDWDNRNLKYAGYNGSSWDIEVVDDGDDSWFSSLALDSAGNPHISYFSQRKDWWSTELRYAYHNGTEWLVQTLDRTPGGYGTYTSIAVDSSGYPRISYDLGWAARYAYYDGSSWHFETVDSDGFSGNYNSMAIDASGRPSISYLTVYDADNAAIKYARRVEIGISDSATLTTSVGDMTVSISEGSYAVPPELVEPGFGIPDGFLTPYGALSYTISTDLGATVTVIVTLPEEPPAGTELFKCINSVCSPIMGAAISGNIVIFDVTDGGDLDEDFKVNGEIVEPSVLAVPAYPEVAVDIKPGSCPNPVNIKSRGKLPVAVLGTNGFDVTTIDPETIRLAGISPLRWALEDVATPYEPYTGKQTVNDCTDAGPDGLTDLTLKFKTEEVVKSLELLLGRELADDEVVVVRLSGNLREVHGSAAFLGEDVVFMLKK